MLILFGILGLFTAGIMTAFAYRKIDLVRLLIVSCSIYISLYVIVSGLLIWMELFTIPTALVVVFLLELLITIALLLFRGMELPRIRLLIVKYIPLFVILTGAGIISNLSTAGFYGTGQDQGLYQIRAMYFMGDYYDNVLDFPEYYNIEHKYEKSHYLEEMQDLTGYYFLKDSSQPDTAEDSGDAGSAGQTATGEESGRADAKENDTDITNTENVKEQEEIGELEGVLHGISTFPALLALWGKLFGLTHMPGIMVVLYLLTIANTWLVCDNLKFRPVTKIMIDVMLTVCPIVLWSSQNTLTEIGIAMFIGLFFVFLTENLKKHLALLTIIPLLAVGFFHVAMSVLMPLVVILYVGNFLQTRDKHYMAALAFGILGYALGFSMMMHTSRYYTVSNLYFLFGKTGFLLNENNILGFVWIVTAVVIVFSFLFMAGPVSGKLLRKWKLTKKKEKGKKLAGNVMMVMAVLTMVVLIVQMILAVNQNMWIMKTGTFCYLITTGYVMLPLAFAGVFVLRREFAGKRGMFNICFSFLYVMLLYCGLVVTSVYYYYYYARYYVPFVMLLLVAAGFVIDRITWKLAIPAAAVCAALVVWQNPLLYQERDLTYGDYQILDNMASCIDEDDCVLIFEQGYHIQRLFALQLKGLTGADIHYADMTRLGKQIEEYGTLYSNVFILTYDIGTFQEDPEEWRYVYQGVMKTSIYDKFVEGGLPYARETVTMESPVALLIWQE